MEFDPPPDERDSPSSGQKLPDPPEARAPLAAPAPDSEMLTRSAASAEAFRELALALRTSVEAMHGVRELQAELVGTLKRQDRSELILQSTQSLNDTFRGLATIQRELLRRLDRSGPAPATHRLVPLMLLGLLIVFLGGVYLVLDVLGAMREERSDTTASLAEAQEASQEAFEKGRGEGLAAAAEGEARLRQQLAEWEERDDARVQEYERIRSEKEAQETENRSLRSNIDNLSSQVRKAQNEVLARRAVEEELRETTTKLAVTEPRLRELELELQSEKVESSRLRKRIAGAAAGFPEEAGPVVPPPIPPAGGSPAPTAQVREAQSPPGRRERAIERDARLLKKIRDRLNQMFDASSRGRGDMWQITRIGGITTDYLDGAVLRRYDRRTGRLLEQVTAERAQIWVDRNRRAVEMEVTGGKRTQGGRDVPLPPRGARHVVADGEMTRLWSQSGLLFLQFR